MTEPSRLLDGDVEVEKTLLRAWSGRQPSDAARLKTLAAAGVGAVLVTAGAGATAAPKATLLSASLVKWLMALGGIIATAGAVTLAMQVRSPTGARTMAETSPIRPVSPVSPSVRLPSPVPTPGDPGGAIAGPLPVSAVPAPAAAPPARKAQPPSSLDEEVLAVDRARSALTSGDATGAVQLVDAYDARYPNGALSQESEEIRVEAFFRAGKRAQAEKLAAQFLSAHPQSPYARAIRALSAAAPSPGP